MFDLTGKTALVTGASGGIGADIARVLHGAGATVGLSGTRTEPLEALAAELGGRVHVLPCNLSDPEAVEGLVKRAVEAMGSVDILVNNAGITRDNLVLRMSDAEWSEVIQTNLTAAFVAIRAAARPMMRGKFGRIVNIASTSGVVGNAGQANYAAAKAGLIGLTKTIARELGGKGITANAVAPGYIETDMTAALPQEIKDKITGMLAVKRLGAPEDIAAAVSYVSGDDAGYLTGQTIVVDGGMTMA